MAGATVRALIGKVNRSAHPLKEGLLSCLTDMNVNGKEPLDPKHDSEDWTDTIDRGGLTHTGNMTYATFVSMAKQFFSWNFIKTRYL